MVVKYTKNGQAYKILASGKAKFIKNPRKGKKRSHTMAKHKKSYSKKQSFMSSAVGTLLAGAIYGAARTKLEAPMANAISKIPYVGTMIPADKLDNVGFGLFSYLMSKGKIPFINKIDGSRQLGKAGLVAEGVLLGAEFATKGLSFNSNGSMID